MTLENRKTHFSESHDIARVSVRSSVSCGYLIIRDDMLEFQALSLTETAAGKSRLREPLWNGLVQNRGIPHILVVS